MDHLDDAASRHMSQALTARVDGGNRGVVGQTIPSASTIEAMVDAVPMVMQARASGSYSFPPRRTLPSHLARSHRL